MEANIQEKIDQLPVHVVTSMKNCMYVVKILQALKEASKKDGTHVYSKKADGVLLCQRLIEAGKADENILINFQKQFEHMVQKMSTPAHKIKKHFMKAVMYSVSLEDITISEFKLELQKLAEINDAKREWKESAMSNETFMDIIDYFYEVCELPN